jgi:hypothetical protein
MILVIDYRFLKRKKSPLFLTGSNPKSTSQLFLILFNNGGDNKITTMMMVVVVVCTLRY